MDIRSLRELYLTELEEACSFERQIVEALDELAARATDPDLKRRLDEGRAGTHGHAESVANMLVRHSVPADAHRDQSMTALLGEARKWSGEISDTAIRDAALIASVQRLQHYQIAVYGALVAWAKQLGLEDRERLLEILADEKRMDAKLSELAMRSVNTRALT